ncbi:MAG TPA: cupin domain-containing protein [Ramlibacter sp.]
MNEKRPRAVPSVQVENERVSVTEWNFAPGAETGWHRHGYAYVVVPESDGRLRIEARDGTSSVSRLRAHQSYYREAGVEHNVINDGAAPFSFVEIEIK